MILLKNCYYIATFNKGDLHNKDILIKKNLVELIEDSIKPQDLFPDDNEHLEIIDCSNLLVMPGMVNTHHHMYQLLTRNLPEAQNAKLFDWLVYLYPIWSNLDEEAVYYSTLAASAELLKTGATLTSDHMYLYPSHFKGDILKLQFSAAQVAGIRFSPTRGSMTRGQSEGGLPPDNVVQDTDTVVKDMERALSIFHDPSPLSMRKIVLAPCSPFSVNEEIMKETAKMGNSEKVVIHTHLAETKDEDQYCIEKYGMRPLQLMEKLGWLGSNVYFAHGIWFNDNELSVLQKSGTGISHCPSSNMRLGSGIARIREMLDRNIPVSLGVDGSASNDSSDMLGEARNALLLQRVRYGSDALTAREALEIATQKGARMLGFTKLGTIQPGMGADLALFDMSSLQYAGSLKDPLAAIVFTGYNHQTAYTIVNGKIVVREGHFTGYNEEKLAEKVNAVAEKLWEKAGL